MTIASAPSGIGAPVMIRIASPAPTGTVGACPAGRSPTTRSRTGSASDAPSVSAAPHRVPVHRGVRERRHRLAGDDGLGEHEPERVGERDGAGASTETDRRTSAWTSSSGITDRPYRPGTALGASEAAS